MIIKIIDRNGKREVGVDFGYHIAYEEENIGQIFYTSDTKEKIEADIANGIYKVVRDDGVVIPQELDYEKAYNELMEAIDNVI